MRAMKEASTGGGLEYTTKAWVPKCKIAVEPGWALRGGKKMLRLLNSARLLVAICFCAAPATVSAGPVDYVIHFTITDPTGLTSIGPGTFSFDSTGVSNAVLDPPVSLPDYQVPVEFSNPFDAGVTHFILDLSDTFTQTSPDDDSLIITGGLVSALNVDSVLPSDHVFGGSTLQLNLDHTWSVTVQVGSTEDSVVKTMAGVDASGMYTLTPTAVPEPGSLGFAAAMLLGIVLYKRIA
jgi:hypothetical protein